VKKAPRSVRQLESFSDVVGELAQKTCIKLWQTTQKQRIVNPKPYIRCIVHTESIDMVRSYTHVLPLPTDEESELYQSNLLIASSEGVEDPACELEQKEVAADLIEEVADALLALPPRQNFAMTC
jgi:DNA-directed RNA polymerase specialized sigma24 family protein